MFEQSFTRHSRISENLKKIEIQQKYTFDTLYDDLGFGFIVQSRLFRLLQKQSQLKGLLQLGAILGMLLITYSLVSPMLSNLLLITYAILQTSYEVIRQKDTKKQLLLFWALFATDILLENYFARERFTLVRYIKLIVVHSCFMYRMKLMTYLVQVDNNFQLTNPRESYFK